MNKWVIVTAILIAMLVLLVLDRLNVQPVLGALLAGCSGSAYYFFMTDKKVSK